DAPPAEYLHRQPWRSALPRARSLRPLLERLVGDFKDAASAQFRDQFERVAIGRFAIDRETGDDLILDDSAQRRRPVRRLPQHARGLIKAEERGIGHRQDHRFVADAARGGVGAASDVSVFHANRSHTSGSGRKVNSQAGTDETKSPTDSSTCAPCAVSPAKNSRLRINRRAADAGDKGTIRFTGPCTRKYKPFIGAAAFTPGVLSSPVNGVPKPQYLSSIFRM